jgi:cytoskeletal protein CcmA (bactofilin family)
MTVSSSTNRASFSGNGSTTVFAYNFKIFDQDDLTVILRSSTGVETTQTITTHYTVSGVGSASGGNVTFGSAPASGVTVVILREQPLTQGLDLVANDPFPSASFEDQLDKLTFMVQQHDEELGRAIKASKTNTISGAEFLISATDRASKVFSFDSSGDLSITQELGTFKGNWAASTAYVERDLVKDTTTNNVFIVNDAHTSSGSQPLTTNTNSAKYTLIIDVSNPAGDLTVGDDLSLTSDAAVLGFGADTDVTLTHVADTGLLLNSTMAIQFNDASQFINAPSATVLDINATDEIELNATLIDVNGNLDVSGTITLGSGAVISEAELEAIDGITAGTVAASKAVVVDSNKDAASFRNLTATGAVTGGSFVIGSADINENDLEAIDGITAGTVAASKAMVVDANKDITGARNVTITGELDAATLDISGDVDVDGTLEADAMTLNGTAITDTATLSTGISNNNVPKFTSGVADDDFLRVNGTAIEGRSASEVLSDIGASAVAGSSSIVTTGALNSGSITSGFGTINTGSSNITTTGVGAFGSLDISGDIDVDGTTNLDAVDVDGAVNFAADVTFADGADIITASAGTSNFRAGVNAGNSIVSGGNYNVVVGDEAGTALTTGDNNVAIGYGAFDSATDQQDNVAIGYNALTAITASGGTLCTAVGSLALAANTAGYHNTAVGYAAQDANTDGIRNVSVGRDSLGADTKGSLNVAIGDSTLAAQNFTTATNGQNTAVGAFAGTAMTTGIYNTMLGAEAGDAMTDADGNVALGWRSLTSNTLGHGSTAVGAQCLFSQNYGSSTNAYNTCVGHSAGYTISTGVSNTLIGGLAGDNFATGSNNVIVGYDSDTAASDTSQIIVLGKGVTSQAANNFTFGFGATDSNIAFGATSITAPSDVRLKEDIQDEKVGLDFIKDLRPVTFRWKKAKDIDPEMRTHDPDSDERVMNGKYNHGFIAQEVKQVIDSYSDIKDGFDMWSADPTDGRQRIGEASLVSIMVKAIQELEARIATLEGAKS